MGLEIFETYYRKRCRKALEAINNEMEGIPKKREQMKISNNIAFDDLSLAKHDVAVPVPVPAEPQPLTLQPTSDHCLIPRSADQFEAPEININAGSIYEISHVHLPTRTPAHLRSVRVAMVSEKTGINVAIRYPSAESLATYFSNSMNEMYPFLDQRFVMGTVLAAKVLLRQVPSQEFAENKHLQEFWVVGDASRKGYCLSELKGNGMLRWGIRRQVKFLGRHSENTNTNTDQSSSSLVKGDDEARLDEAEKGEEEDVEGDDEVSEEDEDREKDEEDEDGVKEEEEEVEEEEEEENGDEEIVMKETNKSLKRKRYNFRTSVRKTKKVKREKQKEKKLKKNVPRKQNRCRQLMVLKNPKDRWSAERYKSAENSLLEVMKAKGAVANNPILRPDLRVEARKKIGDTGLLDHLLKHMAGKIAPGGKDRFRRRHNAEGQMEYWLESADLVNMRKEAGVSDPYWIPPPGWKPGDSPTQDPSCAKELKLLKEEILKIRRDFAKEKANKKQLELEVEVRKLKRELKELKFKNREEDNHAIGVPPGPYEKQELNQLAHSLVCAHLDLDKAPDSLEKCKEQLIIISVLVRELQEKIEKLTHKVEERNKSNSSLKEPTDAYSRRERNQAGEAEQKKNGQERQIGPVEVADIKETGGKTPKVRAEKAPVVAEAAAEGKAAKIERLKSGFRICKPQGTFLWPDMARNNRSTILSPSSQVVVQVENLMVVPTPPSVSSSSVLAPPKLPYYPASPVKPLAERRGVTVTVATVSECSRREDMDLKYSTTTATTTTTSNKGTTMINLNDAPIYPPEVFGGNQSSRSGVTTATVMPHLLSSKEEMSEPSEVAAGDVTRKTTSQEMQITCSSSAPCLSTKTENWLALATATSNSAESSHT